MSQDVLRYTMVNPLQMAIRPIDVRQVNIIAPNVTTQDNLSLLADRLNDDLLPGHDKVIAYVYLEKKVIQWQGYIARITLKTNQAPQIDIDNDPFTREAVYKELR